MFIAHGASWETEFISSPGVSLSLAGDVLRALSVLVADLILVCTPPPPLTLK